MIVYIGMCDDIASFGNTTTMYYNILSVGHKAAFIYTTENFVCILCSLVPRPVEAKEEKGPGFSCSRMRIIITYSSTCTCGAWWKMTFCRHMVSSLTSFVYSELEQRACLLARSRCLRLKPSVCRFVSVYYCDQKQCYIDQQCWDPTQTGKQIYKFTGSSGCLWQGAYRSKFVRNASVG